MSITLICLQSHSQETRFNSCSPIYYKVNEGEQNPQTLENGSSSYVQVSECENRPYPYTLIEALQSHADNSNNPDIIKNSQNDFEVLISSQNLTHSLLDILVRLIKNYDQLDYDTIVNTLNSDPDFYSKNISLYSMEDITGSDQTTTIKLDLIQEQNTSLCDTTTNSCLIEFHYNEQISYMIFLTSKESSSSSNIIDIYQFIRGEKTNPVTHLHQVIPGESNHSMLISHSISLDNNYLKPIELSIFAFTKPDTTYVGLEDHKLLETTHNGYKDLDRTLSEFQQKLNSLK